jgi:hypothetical protein
MPRKRTQTPLPVDARVLQFVPGEIRPLFVKSADIGKIVVGLDAKTMANWRYEKRGPRYFMDRGTPYYRVSDLEEYFSRCPVQTVDD